jgi:hypothetical protein
MTERWQERRVENELLKRELLLRLRAEHSAVPGRGEPATDYFRHRVRRLLLRHPIFALKLYLLLLDAGLGRVGAAERSYLRGRPSRSGADAPRVRGIARSARGSSRLPRDPLRYTAAVGHLGRDFRRQRLRWKPRLANGHRICASAGAAFVAGSRRSALLWFARLGNGLRVCRSFAAARAAELRRAGEMLFARLVRGLRALASWVAALGEEGRRAWLVIGAGRIRAARKSKSMLTSLTRAGRRQQLLMHTRLIRLRRTCRVMSVRVVTLLRQQRLVLRAHLLRAALIGRSAVAGVVAAGRRHWLSLHVGLARFARKRAPASPPWKNKLGLSSVRRARIESTATRAPARTRLPRVAGAVIAGIALTAVAAIAVIATHNVGSNGKPEAARSGNPQPANPIRPGFLHFPATSTRAGAHASPRPARHVERTTARTARRAKPKVTEKLTLVSNTVETASVQAPPAASTATTASHGTGPSPLPAPPGASGPGPLKAPQG